MRREAVALLALALIPVALAEPAGEATRFREGYQVRGALGDIPSTTAEESVGFWNVEEAARLVLDANATTEVVFRLPEGAQFGSVACTCGELAAPAWEGSTARVTVAANASGNHSVWFRHRIPVSAADAFSFQLADPGEARRVDALLLFYLPEQYVLAGPIEADFALPSTSENPGLVIHGFSGSPERPLPAALAFSARVDESSAFARDAPTPTGAATAPAATTSGRASAPDAKSPLARTLLIVLGGLLLGGVGGWYLTERLRRRAPPAKPADDPAILDLRRRALVAALAEIEAARAEGAPEKALARVEAELKADALETMQAIEESGATQQDRP